MRFANLIQYQPHQRVGSQVRHALPLGVLGAATLGWVYASIVGPAPDGFWGYVVAAFALALCGQFGASVVLRRMHSRHGSFNMSVCMGLVWVFLWARWQNTMALLPHMAETSFAALLFTQPMAWIDLWPRLAEHVDNEDLLLWWLLVEPPALIVWSLIGAITVTDKPYSEVNQQWASQRFKAHLKSPGGLVVTSQMLDNSGLNVLLNCKLATDAVVSTPHLEVVGFSVLGDPFGHWVTVTWVTPITNAKGQPTHQRETLISHWVLHQNDFDSLRQLATPP